MLGAAFTHNSLRVLCVMMRLFANRIILLRVRNLAHKRVTTASQAATNLTPNDHDSIALHNTYTHITKILCVLCPLSCLRSYG